MFDNLSTKNKTMVFVAVVLVIFSLLVYGYIYNEQKNILQELEKSSYKHFQESYEKILVKHKEFYENRVRANIRSVGVKEAFKNKDRKQLREISQGRWDTLTSENEYLKVMHFINADGKSFLRMHDINRHSDDIGQKRPMVAKVNKEHKPLDGFEEGVYGFLYRVFLPVFCNDTYIGALEFGSEPKQILEQMNYYNNIKGALFLNKNNNTKQQNGFSLGEYYLAYDNYEKSDVIFEILKDYDFKSRDHHKINNRTYILYSYDMLNYDGKSTAKVVFINDITETMDMYYLRLQSLFIFLFSLLFVLLLIINVGFKKFIAILDKTNNDLKENQKALQAILKEQKEASEKIQDYVKLIDQNIITSTTDLDGRIRHISNAFCTISGYEEAELLGHSFEKIRHPDMEKELFKMMWKALSNDEVFTSELKSLKKNGGFFWVDTTIYPIYDSEKNKIGYTSIGRNITDKKLLEELSITDGLTEIYNRRHFNNLFREIITQSKRKNELLAFIIIDVDFFKLYNDTYGHQKGDEALIKLASALKKSLKRTDDYCFRLGGEEFGIVFKPKDKQEALEFAQTIRKAINNLKIPHKTSEVDEHLSVSMGMIVEYAKEIRSDDVIYKAADDLLYRAKNEGRNRVVSN